MRLIKPFIVISFLCLLVLPVGAQESSKDAYKGPNIKWKQRDVKAAEVKKDKWDQNFHYKVEENPYNERGIASDPDDVSPKKYEQGRDPSSVVEPLDYQFPDDVPQWKWKKEK